MDHGLDVRWQQMGFSFTHDSIFSIATLSRPSRPRLGLQPRRWSSSTRCCEDDGFFLPICSSPQPGTERLCINQNPPLNVTPSLSIIYNSSQDHRNARHNEQKHSTLSGEQI
jgi:hypothetical protein